jgi:hypothetical protein
MSLPTQRIDLGSMGVILAQATAHPICSSNWAVMSEPLTAEELAGDLAPILEALVNLRYLIERGQAELREREASTFERLRSATCPSIG